MVEQSILNLTAKASQGIRRAGRAYTLLCLKTEGRNLKNRLVEGAGKEGAKLPLVVVVVGINGGGHADGPARSNALIVEMVFLIAAVAEHIVDEGDAHILAALHPAGRNRADGGPLVFAGLVLKVEDIVVGVDDDGGGGDPTHGAVLLLGPEAPVVPPLHCPQLLCLPCGQAGQVAGEDGEVLFGPVGWGWLLSLPACDGHAH